MTYEERIERAAETIGEPSDWAKLIAERVVAAYFGDTVLYRHDREAEGSHIHPTCFVQVYPEVKE